MSVLVSVTAEADAFLASRPAIAAAETHANTG